MTFVTGRKKVWKEGWKDAVSNCMKESPQGFIGRKVPLLANCVKESLAVWLDGCEGSFSFLLHERKSGWINGRMDGRMDLLSNLKKVLGPAALEAGFLLYERKSGWSEGWLEGIKSVLLAFKSKVLTFLPQESIGPPVALEAGFLTA